MMRVISMRDFAHSRTAWLISNLKDLPLLGSRRNSSRRRSGIREDGLSPRLSTQQRTPRPFNSNVIILARSAERHSTGETKHPAHFTFHTCHTLLS